MSKIVRAANIMIENEKKISNVTLNNKEYFFKYKGHTWGVSKRDDPSSNNPNIYLYYYPEEYKFEDLITFKDHEWDGINFVTYSSREIGTRECYDTFFELYNILVEKNVGIDKVFDDIFEDTSDLF